jgi:hypothetical protein
MVARGVAKGSFSGEPVVQPATHELVPARERVIIDEHRDRPVE